MVQKKGKVQQKKGGSRGKKDQYTIVLEDLRGQFRIFGEGLEHVSDTLDQHTVQLQRITERLVHAESRLTSIEAELVSIKERFVHAEARLASIEAELEFVKEQLAIIRHNQITRDEFRLLETRVARLERARQK